MLFQALTGLTALLSGGAKILPLGEILAGILGGGDPKGTVTNALRGRLDAEEARAGARALARGVLELTDTVLDPRKADGLTADQRLAVADALVKNAALQSTQFAELLLAYPPLQAAVRAAKDSGDDAALTTARAARTAAAQRIREACVDIGRVAAGEAPRDA
jgi:hypothetical protein